MDEDFMLDDDIDEETMVIEDDDETMVIDDGDRKARRTKMIRYILLGMFALLLVCLVGVLLYNILFVDDGDDIVVDTPTPTPTEGVDVIITPEEPTATPTLVLTEEPTSTAMPEPTEEPTAEPTAEPTTESPADLDLTPIGGGPKVDVLQNGTFEEGFEQGVGKYWQSFRSDSAVIIFAPEIAEPYVKSGDAAQRITVAEATQPDRYAGIYQQVNVVPGQVYSLTLFGQIRSAFGDVNESSYGYRMEYALDYSGGASWQDVPAEAWVELPFDEQAIDSANAEFEAYSTSITAPPDSGTITLFVRTWSKWAVPAEGQYTFDSLSLVGPSPDGIGEGDTEEEMIEKPLPTTGAEDSPSFMSNGVFWGALLVLLLLAIGAIYRAKWSY